MTLHCHYAIAALYIGSSPNCLQNPAGDSPRCLRSLRLSVSRGVARPRTSSSRTVAEGLEPACLVADCSPALELPDRTPVDLTRLASWHPVRAVPGIPVW